MRIRVEISKRDIKLGSREPGNTPVSRALRRAFRGTPYKNFRASKDLLTFSYVFSPEMTLELVTSLPQRIATFMASYLVPDSYVQLDDYQKWIKKHPPLPFTFDTDQSTDVDDLSTIAVVIAGPPEPD